MNKLTTLFLLFLLTPSILLAEESCECPKLTCPPCDTTVEEVKPWKHNLAFGYNQTDGNSDTNLLNIKWTSRYDNDKDYFLFEAEHSTGENDGETNIDYSKVNAEYKSAISDRYYLGSTTTFLRDEIADVEYRVIPQAVVGVFLYKGDSGFFSIEGGPAYTFEKVADVSDDYFSPKIGDRLEYRISETAKIVQTADIFFDTTDGDNYLIQAEAGIETSITKSLTLNFRVRDNYDNQPAPGLKKNDLAFLTSVGLTF